MTGFGPNVGLFVTCLVDVMRPQIGFAALALLEDAGCVVSVPLSQTCCGQPAYNGGDDADARGIAQDVIRAFEAVDYVVVPSGSCAGMIKRHMPGLFEAGSEWQGRASALAAKTYEITCFLHDVLGYVPKARTLRACAVYHDSCSGLRELGIKDQPRRLLERVSGLVLLEHEGAGVCCGFGGTFCVKYPEISARIVANKAEAVGDVDADFLLAGDLGCLMNMAGRISREGGRTRCFHVIELLAGMAPHASDALDAPAIGEAC